MGIIAFIVLGLIAGVIAKAIMPGDDPGGIIVTAIIGIVGAIVLLVIYRLVVDRGGHGRLSAPEPQSATGRARLRRGVRF